MEGTSRRNDLRWCGAVIEEAIVLHQEKSGVSSQASLLGSNRFGHDMRGSLGNLYIALNH